MEIDHVVQVGLIAKFRGMLSGDGGWKEYLCCKTNAQNMQLFE